MYYLILFLYVMSALLCTFYGIEALKKKKFLKSLAWIACASIFLAVEVCVYLHPSYLSPL